MRTFQIFNNKNNSMGLLEHDGYETLEYQQSKPHQKRLKTTGVDQLVRLLKKFKDDKTLYNPYPKFGYEIEGHLLKMIDKGTGNTDYQLELEKDYLLGENKATFNIVIEFMKWMLEAIPKSPMEDYLYSGNLKESLISLFTQIQEILKPGQVFLSFTMPPKLGTPSYLNYLYPGLEPAELLAKNVLSQSEYFVDDMICDHPRYPALTKNVRLRRVELPQMTAAIFKDHYTDMDSVLPGEKLPGQIHLDAFGSAMCSLQVTFGVSCLSEARWLYDQFHVFTPLWLALSASTPFIKGKLLDSDTRWELVCQSQDDRNNDERRPGGISRSRYGPASMFISDDIRNLKNYNDVKKKLNMRVRNQLRVKSKELGFSIDKKLLDHFASLFVRDNLCIFKDSLDHEIDLNCTNLFEAIQSSNWNDVRLKPPPAMDSNIGWRVEFRTMDVQTTPELNFILCHSVQVLSRLLIRLKDQVNLYMPISLVDENFTRANKANAAVDQKFYFRTNIFESGRPLIEELTLSEIFNGKGAYVGLLKIVDVFLSQCMEELAHESSINQVNSSKQVRATFQYLAEVAAGRIPTMASHLRQAIRKHHCYKGDSLLSDNLLDDLTSKLIDLQSGRDKTFINYTKDYIVE